MQKDFTVQEFVDKHNKFAGDTLKGTFVRENLKTEEYVPYNKKMALAEKIVKSSTYATESVIEPENGNIKYQQTNKIQVNSCTRYVLFVYTVIQIYTNINMDSAKMLDEFDLLNREGLIEQIFGRINEKELQEFNKVVQMTFDDFMLNNTTPQSFISNQVQRITDVLGVMLKPIIDKLSNMSEEELQKSVDKIVKFADRKIK